MMKQDLLSVFNHQTAASHEILEENKETDPEYWLAGLSSRPYGL